MDTIEKCYLLKEAEKRMEYAGLNDFIGHEEILEKLIF